MIFIYAWLFFGIIVWLAYDENKFDRYDFLIGLPLVLLFWPRALSKIIRRRK